MNFKFSLKFSLVLLFVSVLLLSAVQLFVVNEFSTKGQEIRGLEAQRRGFENDIRALEKEVAHLGSLSRIQREAEELGLTYNPQAFEYLSSPQLAKAQ